MWKNTYLGPSIQYLNKLGQVIQAIEGSVFASEPDSTWNFCLLSTRSSRKNHLYFLFHIYIHAATNQIKQPQSFLCENCEKIIIFAFPCVIFLLRPSPYSCPDSPSIVASVFASEPDSTCNFFLAQHKKLTKKSLIFVFPYLYPCSHMLCTYIFVKARGPIGIRDTMNSAKKISNHKGPSVRVGRLRLTMQ